MADFDDILARWQASLSPRVPRTVVAQFLSQDGAALREAFEHTSRIARERRSARTFHGWLDRQALAGRDFDDAQLHWLDMMRQDITATGELSLDRFNHGPFLARGGEDKAVRLFGRRTLGEVVASLNATLGRKPSTCGGTCGVKAGGCGCGCKHPKPAPAPDAEAMRVDEVLEAAGLELLEGSLSSVGGLTLYNPPDEHARVRALEALARAKFSTTVWDGRVITRERGQEQGIEA